MAGRLGDKVAIVTGASRGIGKAIARLYAAEGARVLVVYQRDAAAAEATVAEISAAGGEAALIQADVSQKADTERMAAAAIERYGRIDVLCANVGIFPPASLAEMTEEAWDRVQAVNLKSVLFSTQACLPEMQARQYGRIVVIGSTVGPHSGMAGFTHYAASKAGVLGFVRSACLELARAGITINAVEPGPVLTEWVAGVLSEAVVQAYGRAIPMGRMADPLDVAQAALFLATDEARYITGQSLVVDGGLTVPELPLTLFG